MSDFATRTNPALPTQKASLGEFCYPKITIRKSTTDERRAKSSPIVAGGPRCRVPKYIVVGESDRMVLTFGMPTGGDTRAEAVFWAERKANKNDLDFVRPAGWERVKGKLPVEEGE